MNIIKYVTHQSEGKGKADGATPESAAYFLDETFWSNIQKALHSNNIKVIFLRGDYTQGKLILYNIGHLGHFLYLEGDGVEQVTFSQPANVWYGILIDVVRCYNIIFRNLAFTNIGQINFAVRIIGSSRNIQFENCTWIDIPGALFGAVGVLGDNVPEFEITNEHPEYITFRDCSFYRVGLDSHAHMIYNSHHCQYIKVINCHFEDCSGEYVRFRDGVDHCVVYGCTFISTGTFPKDKPINRPFVAIPLFNDCKPGSENCPDPKEHFEYEYFGTNFIIAHNVFNYCVNDLAGNLKYSIEFLHWGFDPPCRRHLLNQQEGQVFESGLSSEFRKNFLKDNCGIDMNKVIVYGNQFIHVSKQVAFESRTYFPGVKANGWEGNVDISDLVNKDSIITPPIWSLLFL